MTRARQLVSVGLRLASCRAQPASASPLFTSSAPSTSTYASIYRTQFTQSLRSTRTRPAMAARMFSTTCAQAHGHIHKPKPGEELYITFVDKDGSEHKFAVAPGDNLLDIAQANDLEMEGACGGSCACSTCHIIVDEKSYDQMPEPDDDENDMLDLAFGLTETSRLGCQVTMTKELDGLVVRLPSMTRNLQASDFESKAAA
ncbi:2fe-2s iron-sulfur cluster binding domain-containing protein [Ophiostoma piceae UAMH 11346]|uniref:2fe-2s iron-sulfur cluster binding domain-containing protein n=1 Tax=Ophiostoma piceae (strain UAMH 11346) TaxID=1262450 RepID=S3BR10_OPHP1|nr:2fe-2s iron-sulfur cluster binding domain-containing protein [Ophiostoma piceae UAMH 11346]